MQAKEGTNQASPISYDSIDEAEENNWIISVNHYNLACDAKTP